MKNPTDRDVIARNALTLGTGVAAYRNGKPVLDAANIGFSWGWWYKNMTMSLVLLTVTVLYAWSTRQWEFAYAQAVLNTLVCGVTYCKLVVQSGFKQRLWFRIWWPVARLMPYTSRVWLYLALFLPVWTLTWFRCYEYAKAH